MGGAIMLNYGGMLDREVGDPLLEIASRVAARAHHLAYQLIG
jgi:hypothetical protein